MDAVSAANKPARALQTAILCNFDKILAPAYMIGERPCGTGPDVKNQKLVRIRMRRFSDMALSACDWFKIDSEQGVAAIEYGLLAALIAVVIIAAVSLLGTNLAGVFQTVATSI